MLWVFNFFLKGYEKEVLNLMSIYLFKDFGLGLVYFEGGGFYVLGELGF